MRTEHNYRAKMPKDPTKEEREWGIQVRRGFAPGDLRSIDHEEVCYIFMHFTRNDLVKMLEKMDKAEGKKQNQGQDQPPPVPVRRRKIRIGRRVERL